MKKWMNSIDLFVSKKFDEISESDLIKCYQTLSKSISFGGYDNDGYKIICIKQSEFYFNEYKNIDTFLFAGLYLFGYITQNINDTKNGVSIICDLNGFGFQNVSFTVLRMGIYCMQKILPIKIKRMLVIDCPWFAHNILNFVLKLMDKKLRNRLILLESSNDIYTYINKDNIPSLIGGNYTDEPLCNTLQNYMKLMNFNHFNVVNLKD